MVGQTTETSPRRGRGGGDTIRKMKQIDNIRRKEEREREKRKSWRMLNFPEYQYQLSLRQAAAKGTRRNCEAQKGGIYSEVEVSHSASLTKSTSFSYCVYIYIGIYIHIYCIYIHNLSMYVHYICSR